MIVGSGGGSVGGAFRTALMRGDIVLSWDRFDLWTWHLMLTRQAGTLTIRMANGKLAAPCVPSLSNTDVGNSSEYTSQKELARS